MKYLKTIGLLDFFYELSGKQEATLFVAKFSYGTLSGKTKIEFNQEVHTFKKFSEMTDYLDELKKYVVSLGFVHGKS